MSETFHVIAPLILGFAAITLLIGLFCLCIAAWVCGFMAVREWMQKRGLND
jgi:hypothetical protein